MTKFVDLAIERDDQGIFDISIEPNGALKTVDSLDTAILMSLYCERRATPSEVSVPAERRGWIGNESNEVLGFEIGSKLWILYRSRLTSDILNEASDYAQQAFTWMIEDNLLQNVTASAELIGSPSKPGIGIRLTLLRIENKVESKFYELWNNTGK